MDQRCADNIPQPMLHFKAVATKRWERVADVALGVFGIVVMIYTTALTVINWASGSGGAAKGYCDS